MLYFMRPYLKSSATWDVATLPAQTVSIEFGSTTIRNRKLGAWSSKPPHVDHHNLTVLPIAGSREDFWMLNGNDGGVALSMNRGDTFSGKDQPQSGYNTSQFYGVSKQPGSSVYIDGT